MNSIHNKVRAGKDPELSDGFNLSEFIDIFEDELNELDSDIEEDDEERDERGTRKKRKRKPVFNLKDVAKNPDVIIEHVRNDNKRTLDSSQIATFDVLSIPEEKMNDQQRQTLETLNNKQQEMLNMSKISSENILANDIALAERRRVERVQHSAQETQERATQQTTAHVAKLQQFITGEIVPPTSLWDTLRNLDKYPMLDPSGAPYKIPNWLWFYAAQRLQDERRENIFQEFPHLFVIDAEQEKREPIFANYTLKLPSGLKFKNKTS